MPRPTNGELKIGELPILKIVDIDSLNFHENPDKFRMNNLVTRFKKEKVLKNPPIVAHHNDDNEYVILDGANRVGALMEIGIKHLVVQVVDLDDKKLIVDNWHHAVEKLDRRFFKKKIKEIDGVSCFDHAENRVHNEINGEILTDDKKQLCTMIFADGRLCTVGSKAELPRQIEQLREIVEAYVSDNLYDRVSYVNLEHLKLHYPNFRTLITFRNFDKEELLDLARQGIKLPAGLTRVFLPKRALGLNIELSFLKSDITLHKKNKELDKLILNMVRDKSIRFYREPTFAFDE